MGMPGMGEDRAVAEVLGTGEDCVALDDCELLSVSIMLSEDPTVRGATAGAASTDVDNVRSAFDGESIGPNYRQRLRLITCR